MKPLNTVLEHAEAHCRSHGSRLTTKRRQVLSGLVQAKRALSAYELVDICKEQFDDKMPPMSVYRILDFLEQEKLVHKLNLANKYVACSHITCSHEHAVPQFLICDRCQRVEEISISQQTLAELEQNVAQAGFVLTSPQLEMQCRCQQCVADAA